MKRILTTLLIFAALPAAFAQMLPYRDASLPVEERLDDLMGRMTLEEKAGQLRVTLGWEYHERVGEDVKLTELFRKEVLEEGVGMVWAAFRADPWTQKSLESGLDPVLAARAANLMQRAVVEGTRLGIPLFLAEEAPHGHMAIGATVFPTGIGLAAGFSPSLMERVGRVIGEEVRASGGHVSYGPVLDLARDPRWSRVEETLGEDPYLAGTLGAALVRGLGGGDLSRPGSTVATLKHFIAYGATEGGHNGSQTLVGPRVLREDFLPPFRRAIEAGALSVMTAYNSLDGIPNTANGELLTDVLRGEWGFNGFVVSDLYAVDGLRGDHRVAAGLREAAALALEAGV
ncbi:MAG: beta-glucosidase, partial [Bacteroidales bacterium]|nr:beta-glucosidase [Bacteroidales bacterium]